MSSLSHDVDSSRYSSVRWSVSYTDTVYVDGRFWPQRDCRQKLLESVARDPKQPLSHAYDQEVEPGWPEDT